MIFLTCNETHVEVSYHKRTGATTNKTKCRTSDEVTKAIRAIALQQSQGDSHTFNALIENVMCSSSMDFPDEYTKDQQIVDLCKEIRS
jgi:hypothetical protein